jgi:hypothetical protein
MTQLFEISVIILAIIGGGFSLIVVIAGISVFFTKEKKPLDLYL